MISLEQYRNWFSPKPCLLRNMIDNYNDNNKNVFSNTDSNKLIYNIKR